jgi:hypothetical protein
MRLTLAATFALATLVAGCPGTTRCTEGMSVACTCTDGRSGAQVCLADGTYGACACVGADAGVDAPVTDVPSTPDVGPVDAPRDAGPPPCIRDIDLVFEIDTSNSMVEEQALLRAELPRLVRVLATGDRNGDGTPDFSPASSLHLGVITPDMGAGSPPPGTVVPTCDEGLGDDGILQARVRSPAAGCPVTYPSGIFEFRSGSDPTAVANDFACVANVGTGGCGFEQQLEAALKALSPSAPTPWVRGDYVAPTFALGTFGHGDDANDGFVRVGSLLAITLVTDEDDCSVPDHSLFYPTDARYMATLLNLRCSAYPAALHPISRFRDGFLQLRDDPRLLVFTAIAGTPTDATFGDSVAGYDMLLDDPDMANRVDPGTMMGLVPSCTGASTGSAFPARRLVETARDLNAAGARTHVGSICSGNYSADINAIIDAIEAGAPACM